MERTDEDLITEYLTSGRQQALSILFERYKTRIFNFCLRFLGSRADAEDAVAEVFLKVTEKKYSYHADARFSTWLYTVARNTSLTVWRKRKNETSMWQRDRNTGQWGEREWPDDRAQPGEQAAVSEQARIIKQAVMSLNDDQRMAIILREYQQLSYAEISQVMKISLAHVKVTIFRAREQLRTRLADYIQGGPDERP